MAFKNVKNREIEKWRSDKQDQLDTHQLHGVSKIAVAAETWLNYLSVNDEWRDRETDLRRLKKKTLSETTEEELEDLYVIDDDDDEADDNAMEVDADIPADDADDQQVIDTLDEQMMDDLAEARDKKGVWVKKGEKKPDIPGSSSAPSTGEEPTSSEAVNKESGSRTWASRARSRAPSRTVLKKANHHVEPSRSPSAGRRRVAFSSDIPETKYYEPTAKKASHIASA